MNVILIILMAYGNGNGWGATSQQVLMPNMASCNREARLARNNSTVRDAFCVDQKIIPSPQGGGHE